LHEAHGVIFGEGDKWDCDFKKNEVYQKYIFYKNMFKINTKPINDSFFCVLIAGQKSA